MSILLTTSLRTQAIKQMYYSPVTQIQGVNISQLYCFLASVTPTANTLSSPTQDQISLKNLMSNIFVVKNITANDISPIIKRVNWTSNTIYDYYQDNIDMNAVDINGNNVYNYYIKNKYDQIFKCLWNNNSTPSIIEPFFEPGTYSTNNIYTSSDGYKWKYIYTIDLASKVKFMDSKWIPIPATSYFPNPIANPTIGIGNIDVINVTSGGTGYDPANSAITITISGPNTISANGVAVVSNGAISDIIVTNTGTDYSYANVAITSSLGQNATAIAPVSPIGGHGSDPITELGCTSVMITSTFNGSETDPSGIPIIPTDITYYQVGLLINPTSTDSSPAIASGSIYKTSTDLIVSAGSGTFASGDIIYQGQSLNLATFSATVLSFDAINNIVKTINTSGTLSTNALVYSSTTSTTRTLLSYSTPNFITTSGYVGYIENRDGIQRSVDGIEQIKIILSY